MSKPNNKRRADSGGGNQSNPSTSVDINRTKFHKYLNRNYGWNSTCNECQIQFDDPDVLKWHLDDTCAVICAPCLVRGHFGAISWFHNETANELERKTR